MKTLNLAAVVLLCVGTVCCGHLHRHKRWSVHTPIIEAAPSMAGEQLLDVLVRTPDIRHSDRGMRLTAVKNGKFKACFIVDLDPNFNLDEDEMRRITTEKVPENVNSPDDLYEFRREAGPDIAAMCQHMDVYWLNAVAPPIPVINVPEMVKAPEPIKTNIHEAPRPLSRLIAPPPVNVYHALHDSSENNSGPKAPPPLSEYLQQQANQNVQHTERVTMAPPPLALWRQQQTNQNAQQAEGVKIAPPPLLLRRN